MNNNYYVKYQNQYDTYNTIQGNLSFQEAFKLYEELFEKYDYIEIGKVKYVPIESKR